MDLSKIQNFESRSISAENFKGEKGKGGMAERGTGSNASRELGKGWKVSPSIVIPSKQTFEIANIDGPGCIKHIWMTDDARARNLILRIYFDGRKNPAVSAPLSDFFCKAAAHREFRQISTLPSRSTTIS